jgi:Ran GTPase-activating protein (RanGAP) involved in mRNA processing and transport
MTELYTKIILNLILRNVRKFDTYKSILKLPKFDSLPADLQQSWWLLCEFAFQALEKDQLVFSQEELEAFFPEGLALDKRILCFGLLQSAESVGVGISFHFLHLTFQEYLAALYLTRQPTDKQLEAFQTHKSKYLSHRFKMVWKFFFGINSNLEFGTDKISFIQQSLECVAGDLHDHLSVCHCAFEAHNDLINKEVTQYLDPLFNTVNLGSPRTAHDCSAVLYVIANLQECGRGLTINFNNASENQVKALMHILSSKKGKLLISKLDLHGSRLTVSSLQALESAVCGDVLAELADLDLDGSLTSDADTNAKWLATLSDHCPNLERLDLSNNNLGVPGASALAKLHVSGRLSLNKTNLGDKGLTILVMSLKVIYGLGLADNDIHASGVSCFADAVCSGELKLMYLGRLEIHGNPLGLEGTRAVGRMLSSSHCKSSGVFLSRCDLTTVGGGLPSTDSISCEAVGRQLCQMPQTSTIVILDLNHNSFTGDGIHILAGFMHLCPGLYSLGTRDCGITSDDLIWLLGKLKSSSPGVCSELKVWYLEDNQIDGRGVSALIDHLPLLPRLGCGGFTFGIHSLSSNPVMHNNEMMERLKEELTRRRQEREEEKRQEREKLARRRQEREEEKRQEREKLARRRREREEVLTRHREREKSREEEVHKEVS